MKTILITGASRGFGRLTAIKCANRGFHVIATMRNVTTENNFEYESELTDDARKNIEVWTLDVTDVHSIRQFKLQLEKSGPIDILINNAGFAVGGFAEQIPVELYRKQFETNFFGAVQVTQAVLPHMRRRGCGNILNVSSISGRIGFPGLSAYAASKHALEGWSESLRFEMKPFGIDVALIEPGSYQTNIWEGGMEVAGDLRDPSSPYHHLGKTLWNEVNQSTRKQPHEVAAQMAYLSEKDHWKKLRYPIGRRVPFMIFAKTIMPWKWYEKIVHKKLKW